MGFERGFLDYERIEPSITPVAERILNFKEYYSTLSDHDAMIQAGRCMDCGTPFCMHQCPLHNSIPDFNDFVCRGEYRKALNVLQSTNSFPEFTGRLCPALCEEGCTLSIHREAVGIKSVERKIAEYAFEHGLIHAEPSTHRSFKKVAIVGSGPAALSCAQALSQRGHNVTVYEKNDKAGGLLRYGIPDFKLPKEILDRRLSVMESEGITFKTGVLVGSPENQSNGVFCNAKESISGKELLGKYSAVVLCPGSEVPRDLKIPGRELSGVHYALDFLIAQNLEIQGAKENQIDVAGKNVVVIGGGETASDCIGTAIRKGAKCVTQLDYHDELPEKVDVFNTWPEWRRIKRTSPSQKEGCTRLFSTNTTSFVGKEGKLCGITTQKVRWGKGHHFEGLAGTDGAMDADVALIAMGYSHPSPALAQEFGLETDNRGNIKASYEGDEAFKTNNPKVFAAGDGRRGQSLVVWALAEGRRCAEAVDRYLMSIPHA